MIKILLLGLIGISGGSVLTLTCVRYFHPNETTKLTQQVERAGAGNIAGMSMYGMMAWFNNHPAVATGIGPQCTWLGKNRPAQWNDSLEGRVCRAAEPVIAQHVLIGPGDDWTVSN